MIFMHRLSRKMLPCLIPVVLAGLFSGAFEEGASRGDFQPQHNGEHGHGHDVLHHWYETLRQPGTGYPCCNNQDCRPTTARRAGADIEVLVDGQWTAVRPELIIEAMPPDANHHVCAPKGPWIPKPIFCVVLATGM
jgi:hypothetical protein